MQGQTNEGSDYTKERIKRYAENVLLLLLFKGALYRIWCGVNRLGDNGVKVV